MRWKKIIIHTTAEAEDIVSAALMELGAEGVEIEDNVPLSEEDVKKMFIDILPDQSANDGTARVSFYLHEYVPGEKTEKVCEEGIIDDSYAIHDRIWTEEEAAELLSAIETALSDLREFADIGEGRIETEISEETDWRDNWKQFFQPILVGRILILPSWLPVPPEYEAEVQDGTVKTVLIDPGVAFGTGSHESTRLCIPELSRHVREGSLVLDLGTGSGILGMAASKLGAGLVTAVDIDPACEEVLRENTAANGIGGSFRIITGNVLSADGTSEKILEAASFAGTGGAAAGSMIPYGPYDVVAANILAPVIEALSAPGNADRFLKKGGVFITSGILDIYQDDVIAAMSANPSWQDISVTKENEWVCVKAVRA